MNNGKVLTKPKRSPFPKFFSNPRVLRKDFFPWTKYNTTKEERQHKRLKRKRRNYQLNI